MSIKALSAFVMLFVSQVSFAANTKTVRFTATTGETLRLRWTPVLTESFGAVATTTPEFNIAFESRNVYPSESTVYLIHTCYVAGTTEVIEDQSFTVRYVNDIESSPLTFAPTKEFRHPEFMLNYADLELQIQCVTEASILIDGNWLVDPINGTKHFKIFH